MRIQEIIQETTSGGIAIVAGTVGKLGRRGPYFGEPVAEEEKKAPAKNTPRSRKNK